jgi:hypothetical protein
MTVNHSDYIYFRYLAIIMLQSITGGINKMCRNWAAREGRSEFEKVSALITLRG